MPDYKRDEGDDGTTPPAPALDPNYLRGWDAASKAFSSPLIIPTKGSNAMEVKLPNLSALTSFVESLVAPFEKLAAYFAVAGVGVADYPHLPTTVRAVLAAVGGYHVVQTRKAAPPAA